MKMDNAENGGKEKAQARTMNVKIESIHAQLLPEVDKTISDLKSSPLFQLYLENEVKQKVNDLYLSKKTFYTKILSLVALVSTGLFGWNYYSLSQYKEKWQESLNAASAGIADLTIQMDGFKETKEIYAKYVENQNSLYGQQSMLMGEHAKTLQSKADFLGTQTTGLQSEVQNLSSEAERLRKKLSETQDLETRVSQIVTDYENAKKQLEEKLAWFQGASGNVLSTNQSALRGLQDSIRIEMQALRDARFEWRANKLVYFHSQAATDRIKSKGMDEIEINLKSRDKAPDSLNVEINDSLVCTLPLKEGIQRLGSTLYYLNVLNLRREKKKNQMFAALAFDGGR
jgi:chromosome segregation ATPase